MKLASLKVIGILAMITAGTNLSIAQHPVIDMLGVGGGKCETLVNWAQPLQLEFAGGNYYSRDVFAKTVTLFTDEYFVPHFGKPYADLSKGERKKYLKAFTACFRNRKYIQQMNSIPEIRNLVQAFNEVPGQWSSAGIVQAVSEHGEQWSQYQQIQDYLNGDPILITENKLNELRRIVPDMGRSRYVQSGTFKYLWPSKLVALSDLIGQKREVAKENEYRSQAQRILTGPNNLQTLRQLTNFTNSSYHQGVGPDVRQRVQLQLAQKRSELLAFLMQTENTKLEGIEGGQQGLVEITSWFNVLQRDYGNYRNDPQVDRVFNSFFQKHDAFLIENKNLISSQISQAVTTEELNLIASRYLCYANQKSLAQLQLASQINDRKAAIQAVADTKAREASAEAAKELQRKLTATTASGEPTEFQMKVAYEFQVGAKNEEYDRAMQQLEQLGGGSMKNATALMQLLVPKTETTVNTFEKIACEKAQGKPGYVCDYAAQKSVNAGYIGTVQGTNNVNSARFVRKSNGVWQIVEYLND